MTSTRPYLVRAFYEWIVDNNLTPYIIVNADKEGVMVPREYVNNGKIVFNISPHLVQSLNLSNNEIEFEARFSGILKYIYTPMNAVMAIYARENGRGMVFENEEDDVDGDGGNGEVVTKPEKPPKGKPKLRVVK